MQSVVRYRFRAYPDAGQTRALNRTLGCCRVVFNDVIAARRDARAAGLPMPSAGALSKELITAAKHRPDRAWLSEVSAVALQQALADADVAYRNFFNFLAGRRAGRKVGAPWFRSRRDSTQTARFTSAARFQVNDPDLESRSARVRLPKIGDVRLAWSRNLPSDPTSVTMIREADGRWYASFVVRVTDSPAPTTGRVCAIDMGLSSFATLVSVNTATGEQAESVIDTPLFLRRKARALARSQKALARKQRGSANRVKAVRRVAVHHRNVRQSRLDHAHQHAARIVATHDLIAIEDLSIAGMAKTHLAASVHDQSMGQFLRLLADKAARQGRTLVKVGRFYPSTRTCSGCGAITGPRGQSQLGVRHWTCTTCGADHDRDRNAARNILTEGLRLHSLNVHTTIDADGRSESLNAPGGAVRPVLAQAVSGERGSLTDSPKQRCSPAV
jgi:putative transposase